MAPESSVSNLHGGIVSKPKLFIALALTTVCSYRGWAQSPSPENDAIAVIRVYEGTWKFRSDSLDTNHSKAGHGEKEIRNDAHCRALFMNPSAI
jgi:hypothetical protein